MNSTNLNSTNLNSTNLNSTDNIVQLDDQDLRIIDAAINALDRPIQDKLEPIVK